MSEQNELDTKKEKEQVLDNLVAQENALKAKQKGAELSEDDFVQYLNLATKKFLVSRASDLTLQQLAEKDEKERQAEKKDNQAGSNDGVVTAATVGALTGGVQGAAAMGVAASAGSSLAALVIGAPIGAGIWLWGKGKEIGRTFKTSYQNDSGKNRLGRALWRAIKYPLFKVPLVNKMRQDFNFKATPQERLEFKKEAKQNMLNSLKKEAIILGKFAGAGALFFGTVTGLMGGAAAITSGNVGAFTEMLGIGLTIGSALGTCVYPMFGVIRAVDKIEAKSKRGRRLIEQALNYPPVKQMVQSEEKTADADERHDVKARFRTDQSLAHLAEKSIGKDDGMPNVFDKLRNRIPNRKRTKTLSDIMTKDAKEKISER